MNDAWDFVCECGHEWVGQDGPDDICPICTKAVRHAQSDEGLPQVAVSPAFEWRCPDCGEVNYSGAVIAELTQEQEDELINEHGVQPQADGQWLRIPRVLVCGRCECFCRARDD